MGMLEFFHHPWHFGPLRAISQPARTQFPCFCVSTCKFRLENSNPSGHGKPPPNNSPPGLLFGHTKSGSRGFVTWGKTRSQKSTQNSPSKLHRSLLWHLDFTLKKKKQQVFGISLHQFQSFLWFLQHFLWCSPHFSSPLQLSERGVYYLGNSILMGVIIWGGGASVEVVLSFVEKFIFRIFSGASQMLLASVPDQPQEN